jgi:hypothetical protein
VLGDCNNYRSFDFLASLLFAVLKFRLNASIAVGLLHNNVIYLCKLKTASQVPTGQTGLSIRILSGEGGGAAARINHSWPPGQMVPEKR